MRTQTIWLTLPLLARGAARSRRARRGRRAARQRDDVLDRRARLGGSALVASGGLARYRAAFAGQAAEQFTGLDIFLSNPTPRRMALGIIAALVGPWAAPPLGWIVVAIAIAGLALLAWRAPLRRGAAARGVRAVRDLSSHRSGDVQPVRAADRACGRVSGGQRAVGCWNERGATFGKRGDCRGVAGRHAACGEGVLASIPSPAYAAVERFAAARGESPGSVVGAHQRFARVLETRDIRRRRSCRRRSCASRPSLRRTGAAAARRRCGICPIRRAAISSWSIR